MIQLSTSPRVEAVLQNKIKLPRRQPAVTEAFSLKLYKYVEGFTGAATLTPHNITEIDRLLSTPLCTPLGRLIGILQYFQHNPFTAKHLTNLTRRLAAQRQQLKKGALPNLYIGSGAPEWAPCKVISVISRSGKSYLTCQFIDGEANGITFTVRANLGYRFFKEAGLTRKMLKGVQLLPQELVTFIYYALLMPNNYTPFTRGTMTPSIDAKHIAALKTTASQRSFNKHHHMSRQEPCPVGLSLPCSTCFVGLDKCPRACKMVSNWAFNTNPPQEIICGQNK